MIASQSFTCNEISFFHFHTNYKRTNLILKGIHKEQSTDTDKICETLPLARVTLFLEYRNIE